MYGYIRMDTHDIMWIYSEAGFLFNITDCLCRNIILRNSPRASPDGPRDRQHKTF